MGRIKSVLLLSIGVLLAFSGSVFAKEKLGLIIIAHGSPRLEWNAPVLKIEKQVENIMAKKKNNPFSEVKVALMEFNEPSINTIVKNMEKKGIDGIYAIPLFIAPSGHSVYDVPAILGLYSDKEMIKTLKEEGITIVNTKIKITIGPTLNIGDVLKEIMSDRVKALSNAPDGEGVVLLAHGDSHFEPIWTSLCEDISSYIRGETGIKYFDYAFVGVGQSFVSKGAPVILKTSDKHKATIVVGLYLSMGVERMALNAIGKGMMKIDGKNVSFAKQGLLPDMRIAKWIADRAMEYIESSR